MEELELEVNKDLKDFKLHAPMDRCVYYDKTFGYLSSDKILKYVNQGCYNCEGYNKNCDHYLSHKSVYEMVLYSDLGIPSNLNKEKQ